MCSISISRLKQLGFWRVSICNCPIGKNVNKWIAKHGRRTTPYVISLPEKRPSLGPAEIVIGYKKYTERVVKYAKRQ